MTEQVNWQPLQSVIFDWGGTLTPWHTVDLAEPWRLFAREIHGLPFDQASEEDRREAEALAARVGAAEARMWQRGRDDHAAASLDDVFAEAGLDPEHDRHSLGLAAYHGYWEPHTYTDPQVRPLWEGLHARGLKVGVLSNTIWPRSYHEGIFERDGVEHLIDADLYTSEMEVVKPHPDAFRAICAKLGVDPLASVYVGDRLFEDIHGPHQIGMRAIHIPHSEIPADQLVEAGDQRPDGVAHELLDILEIIEPWR